MYFGLRSSETSCHCAADGAGGVPCNTWSTGAALAPSLKSRTADLGILDLAAQWHEGPVWGSCAAATVILAKVRNGPSLPDKPTRLGVQHAAPPQVRFEPLPSAVCRELLDEIGNYSAVRGQIQVLFDLCWRFLHELETQEQVFVELRADRGQDTADLSEHVVTAMRSVHQNDRLADDLVTGYEPVYRVL